jgi:glycosyltransferase 2 family protein
VSRPVKVTLQVLLSGGIIAFLLWRIDLGQTVDVLRESDYIYVAASLALFLGTTWLMAWRWWVLLRARGIDESYGWLVRMYFVSYAAGQVLPTAVGGDAVRIIEHARRRPRVTATAAGAVVMERILGSAGTLVLVAVGLAVAARR